MPIRPSRPPRPPRSPRADRAARPARWRRLLAALGPGIVTGVADGTSDVSPWCREQVQALDALGGASAPRLPTRAGVPATPQRLPAWDREVLEVLVAVPQGAGLVIREVPLEDVESGACRAVLETARRIHEEGRDVCLRTLLLELADPALHSMLVGIDSFVQADGAAPPAERIAHLADALRRRRAARAADEGLRTLKSSRLDAEAEAEVLERLVARRREAQGMTDPKDG